MLRRVVVCLSLALLLTGCGRTAAIPQGQVHGSATIDGQPLTAGQIEFFSTERGAGAMTTIQADGTYVLEDSLPTGEYVVTVADQVPEPGQPPSQGRNIPLKYGQVDTSVLKCTIAQGENTFHLELSSK